MGVGLGVGPDFGSTRYCIAHLVFSHVLTFATHKIEPKLTQLKLSNWDVSESQRYIRLALRGQKTFPRP